MHCHCVSVHPLSARIPILCMSVCAPQETPQKKNKQKRLDKNGLRFDQRLAVAKCISMPLSFCMVVWHVCFVPIAGLYDISPKTFPIRFQENGNRQVHFFPQCDLFRFFRSYPAPREEKHTHRQTYDTSVLWTNKCIAKRKQTPRSKSEEKKK